MTVAAVKNDEKLELVTPTLAQLRARRSRNIAIGVALAIFVVVVYAVTLTRLGSNVFNRPM